MDAGLTSIFFVKEQQERGWKVFPSERTTYLGQRWAEEAGEVDRSLEVSLFRRWFELKVQRKLRHVNLTCQRLPLSKDRNAGPVTSRHTKKDKSQLMADLLPQNVRSATIPRQPNGSLGMVVRERDDGTNLLFG